MKRENEYLETARTWRGNDGCAYPFEMLVGDGCWLRVSTELVRKGAWIRLADELLDNDVFGFMFQVSDDPVRDASRPGRYAIKASVGRVDEDRIQWPPHMRDEVNGWLAVDGPYTLRG